MNSASRQPSSAPAAGDVEDLVGGEVQRPPGPLEVARRRHERAVVAPVAAQPGDRDEDLGRVRDDPGPAGRDQPGVAHPGRGGAEPVEVLAGRGQQHRGLGDVERRAALGTRQRPSYLLGGGLRAHRAQASRDRAGGPRGPGPGTPHPRGVAQTGTSARSAAGLRRRGHGVLAAVERARPPDPAAEVEVQGGDEHRADDHRVEEDAERDRDADLDEGDQRQRPQHEERRGQHQAGGGDHAAGGRQRDQRARVGCRGSGSPPAPGSSGRCCSRCPGRRGRRTRTAATTRPRPAKPKT